jgi:phosphatidylglycerophosphatase A
MTEKRTCIDNLALGIARLGVAGLSPKGPGTCGSVVAVLLAPWCFMPLPFYWQIAVLVLIFLVGSWASGRAEQILNEKDPSQVVVDELLGQWIAILPLGAVINIWQLLAALVLFRIFDIAKPWPIKASEDWLPGGWGVMLDDLLAGVAAAIVLWLGLYFLT